MTVVIIDFRIKRRLGVARLAGADPSGVFETCPDGIAAMARPCLVLWHVGYDQNREEGGQLRAQLELFLMTGKSWVAAYTGGQVPRNLLPAENDQFVVRGDGGHDAAPTGAFKSAIGDVVAHWNKTGGALSPRQLPKVWGGRDFANEAKLSLLFELFAGRPPSQESMQVLREQYPWLDEAIAAIRPGDNAALEALRKRLFE